MIKHVLRIILAPFMLTIRLMLGIAAFITSIASSVIGITVYSAVHHRVCDRLLAERVCIYGACAAGQPHWTSCHCKLSSEPDGSYSRIL